MQFSFILSLAVIWLTSVARAEVSLSAVFSDHAVLQRDQSLPIWGLATPGEKVYVTLGEQRSETVADGDGRWRVRLAAQPASNSPLVLEAVGSNSVSRSNILLGDVWHASGQSNMAMTVGAVVDSLGISARIVATSDYPAIRFLRINEGESRQPLIELGSRPKWTVCAPTTVSTFSAAAFFFARKIHQELGVPVGVIDTSRGGTPIEPFIPRAAFRGHPTLVRELELGDREDLAGIWRLIGGVRARDANWLPGRLFHSRLAPISDFAVRGCIWYQGESNCGDGEDPRDYQHKMRALVTGWRQAFGRDDLPFFYVQLPGSGAGPNWPYLREQQRLSADLPNTGMVVTIDLAHPDIHPPNKIDVGERLARWALAREYGQAIPCCGPWFWNADINGNRVTVEFAHANSGLMIATKFGLDPPREQPGGQLNHFQLTDSSGGWHAAKAVIAGGKVMVTSDQVERPLAVRYGYAVSPRDCNLYNRDGLPASPFCSRPDLLTCDPGLPED